MMNWGQINIFSAVGTVVIGTIVVLEARSVARTHRREQHLTRIVEYLAEHPDGATLAQIAEDLGRSPLDPRMSDDLSTLLLQQVVTKAPHRYGAWRYKLAGTPRNRTAPP